MLAEKSAAQKLRQRGLRQLVGMQIRCLFHHAQPFYGLWRRNNPTHAQPGERYFRKAVDVNHQIRTIQLLQRGNALVPRVQPRVNMVFHHGHLIPPRQLQQFAPRSQRHRNARGILKIRSQRDQLHTICRKSRFERLQVQSQRRSRLRVGSHRHSQAARPRPMENRHRARVGRIFHNHGIARTHKRFADQIERLLAPIGDEQIFVSRRDSVVMQQIQQSRFQRRIAIGRTQGQNFPALAPQHRVHTDLQFLNGEKFRRGTSHNERQSAVRHTGGQPAQHFLAALIGKQQFPADASIAIQNWRSRRGDLQTVAISLDKRPAAHVSLDQSFRFQFGVGIGHGGSVHAEHGRQLAACRDAVARAQITGMHQGAKLIAKLHI